MRILLSALLVVLLAGSALAAERVNDAEHGFTLVVPDGFVDAPQAKGPNMLHAYQRGNLDEASFALIQVASLGGTIGPGSMDRVLAENAVRQAAQKQGAVLGGFAYRKVKWKDFDLQIMVVTMGADDKKVVTLAVQVPISKQALQVQIVGPAAEEARLGKELDTFLAGLDGPSDWLTDAQKSEKISRLIGIGVGLLLGLGILVWWKRRQARAAA